MFDDTIILRQMPKWGYPQEKIEQEGKWVKHVVCEGARFHVISWVLVNGRVRRFCSEPNCIINKDN